MVPLSRRRLLQVAASVPVVGVTAGCGERRRTSPATETSRPSVAYQTVRVRSPDGTPFVRYRTEDGGESTEFVEAVLATADDAGRVSFTREVPGVDDARAFLAETDFERAVVYLAERRIQECRTLAVEAVTTDGDSFDLDFCSPLRPADVACRVDRHDVVVVLVRFPLDAADISSYSVGGGGSCRRRREGSA